ncbi:hypothetical protein J2Y69_000079 [Microbacterium resistens]|uniref:Uncharacterized protein n=1 Tax=Microbacterium resistens TaxID=156977 RepID=A0ABU1S7B4_9MICO|nr:hypothetical protein [Microbacterium resistens]MDR6865497.1 hypothetical protein [Microbacterium resistens]
MNHQEFMQRMMDLGYSNQEVDRLIWISVDGVESNLTQREYNFVPVGDGLYEVFLPSDRRGYFKASVSYGVPFVGSLEEAYLWVYKDRAGL